MAELTAADYAAMDEMIVKNLDEYGFNINGIFIGHRAFFTKFWVAASSKIPNPWKFRYQLEAHVRQFLRNGVLYYIPPGVQFHQSLDDKKMKSWVLSSFPTLAYDGSVFVGQDVFIERLTKNLRTPSWRASIRPMVVDFFNDGRFFMRKPLLNLPTQAREPTQMDEEVKDEPLLKKMDEYILQKLDQVGFNADGNFVGCKFFTPQVISDAPVSWVLELPKRIRHLIQNGAVDMIPRDPKFAKAPVKAPSPGQKMTDWFLEVYPIVAYGQDGFVGEQVLCQRLVRNCPNTVWHLNIPIVVKQYMEDYRFYCKPRGINVNAAIPAKMPVKSELSTQPASSLSISAIPILKPKDIAVSAKPTASLTAEDIAKRSPRYYKENYTLTTAGAFLVDKIDTLYWHRTDLSDIDRWILYNYMPCTIDLLTGNPRIGDGKFDLIKLAIREHPEWEEAVRSKLNRIQKSKPLTLPDEHPQNSGPIGRSPTQQRTTWAALLTSKPPSPVPVLTQPQSQDKPDIERYNYECSPEYYKTHVDMPPAARKWVAQIGSTYWNRQDLSKLDRWILRNLLSCVIRNWKGTLHPSHEDHEDGAKQELIRRCAVEHPGWRRMIANKLNRIYENKPMTYPIEFERGLPGATCVGPMILRPSSVFSPNSSTAPIKPTQTRSEPVSSSKLKESSSLDTSLNLETLSGSIATDYVYYNVESSPEYYKSNYVLDPAVLQWINEIERLYWNRKDLSSVDRWILRNLLPSSIRTSSTSSVPVATMSQDCGRAEILKLCMNEHPEWTKVVELRLSLIIRGKRLTTLAEDKTHGPMVLRPSGNDSSVAELFNTPLHSSEMPPVSLDILTPAGSESNQKRQCGSLATSFSPHPTYPSAVPLMPIISPKIASQSPQLISPPPFAPSPAKSTADIPFIATEDWILHHLSSYNGNDENTVSFLWNKKREFDGSCSFMEKLKITTAHQKLVQFGKLPLHSASPSASGSKMSSPSPCKARTGISSSPSTSTGTSITDSDPSRWDSLAVDMTGGDNFSDYVSLSENNFIATVPSSTRPTSLATSPSPAPVAQTEEKPEELLINFNSSNDRLYDLSAYEKSSEKTEAPTTLEKYSWNLPVLEPSRYYGWSEKKKGKQPESQLHLDEIQSIEDIWTTSKNTAIGGLGSIGWGSAPVRPKEKSKPQNTIWDSPKIPNTERKKIQETLLVIDSPALPIVKDTGVGSSGSNISAVGKPSVNNQQQRDIRPREVQQTPRTPTRILSINLEENSILPKELPQSLKLHHTTAEMANEKASFSPLSVKSTASKSPSAFSSNPPTSPLTKSSNAQRRRRNRRQTPNAVIAVGNPSPAAPVPPTQQKDAPHSSQVTSNAPESLFASHFPSMEAQSSLLDISGSTSTSAEIQKAVLFTPGIFSDPAIPRLIPQYSLLGIAIPSTSGFLSDLPLTSRRIFQNTHTPSSYFICGLQGSGKSHTTSCIIENHLLPVPELGTLTSSSSAMVLNYNEYTTGSSARPCEVTYLGLASSTGGPKVNTVNVLVPPSNFRKATSGTGAYSPSVIPGVQVKALKIRPKDLTTTAMKKLMSVDHKGQPPLYLGLVEKVLRDMGTEREDDTFDYGEFKRRLMALQLTDMQRAPLDQRLCLLEEFLDMPCGVPAAAVRGRPGVASNMRKVPESQGCFDFAPGSLTVVDLSCRHVDENMACVLFDICIGIYLGDTKSKGKIIAVDEAHKYMTDTPGAKLLTKTLLTCIRLQRHLGLRVLISTQEPSIDPRLISLASSTIVHRFTSPEWFSALKGHIAVRGGPEEEAALLERIQELGVGEALVWAPTGMVEDQREEMGRGLWKGELVKVKMRRRITYDGGKSVFAG